MRKLNKYIPTLITMVSHNIINNINPRRINVIHEGAITEPLAETGAVYLVNNIVKSNYLSAGAAIIESYAGNQRYELRRLENAGFLVPPFKDVSTTRQYGGILEHGKKYVLKANYSARSIGKAVVDKVTFMRMLRFHAHVTEYNVDVHSEFNKKFNIPEGHAIGPDEKYKLSKSMVSDSYIIQDFVDIDEEYRIFFIDVPEGDKFTVMRRFGCGIGTDEEQDIYKVALNNIPKSVINSVKKYTKLYPTPVCCFDIYKDKDGQWGCFEVTSNWGDEGIEDAFGDTITDAYLHHMRMANPLISVLEEAANKALQTEKVVKKIKSKK